MPVSQWLNRLIDLEIKKESASSVSRNTHPTALYVLLAPLGLASGMLQALNLGENKPVYFGPKGLWALAVWVKATALLTSV